MKPKRILVIFDGDCVLCRRSVHWLEEHSTHIAIVTAPASHPPTEAVYGRLPGYGDNMVVVAGDGRVWIGPPDAYLVVMWAVRGTRLLSYLLSLPPLKTLAGRAFQLVVGNRHTIGRLFSDHCEHCVAVS